MSEPLTRNVVTFGRVLREAGLEVGPSRVADALTGLDRIGLDRRDDVYFALRTTLVSRREDLEVFDRAFAAWFEGRVRKPPRRPASDPRPAQQGAPRVRRDAGVTDATPGDPDPEAVGTSAHEILRRRDFAAMSPEELRAARALMTAVAARRPLRRSRRTKPRRRGHRLDLRALSRDALRTGGDPVRRRYRRRTTARRKLVVLCDVSGSMEAYTRALLLYLHATVRSGGGVEVFAFGTRLTRLTGDLRTRDPEQALARAADRVVDWASGTKIGESLREYNDVWGRRALTRGAVVLIVSDGWEQGDPALLAAQMGRLHRQAHTVVWVNPQKGGRDYEPLAGGMAAALPHVDRFVTGHDLASLDALGALLEGLDHRHGGTRPTNP